MNGYGPYRATFRGGVLDGQEHDVPSTAPGRIVFHSERPARARAWSGKPHPRRPYDVYEIEGHDVGGDGTCTYNFVRTVR